MNQRKSDKYLTVLLLAISLLGLALAFGQKVNPPKIPPFTEEMAAPLDQDLGGEVLTIIKRRRGL